MRIAVICDGDDSNKDSSSSKSWRMSSSSSGSNSKGRRRNSSSNSNSVDVGSQKKHSPYSCFLHINNHRVFHSTPFPNKKL